MLHFSCDMCRQSLPPGHNTRYVIQMEVYAAAEIVPLTEQDLDSDSLDDLSDYLTELEASPHPATTPAVPAYQKLRYDLCAHCHSRFMRDPLNRDAAPKLDFSKN